MDLLSRWTGSWTALGGVPDPALLSGLLAAYSEPHRHYHTLRHIEECFERFDEVKSLARHGAEVELALWFHDAIYDTRRKDNEERSAKWALQAIAPVCAESAYRVRELVLATRHAERPPGIDAEILVDVDLWILGAAQARFDEYDQQVRREYGWVPMPLYRRERRTVLESFLKDDLIFATPEFVRRYEAQARRNLERALARL